MNGWAATRGFGSRLRYDEEAEAENPDRVLWNHKWDAYCSL